MPPRLRAPFLPLLLVALTFALAGCTRPVDGVTRLQFSFWGSVLQQKVEEELVRAFEREHPDVKVELLAIGSRYNEKLQAMMVGDVAPDIIMTELGQYSEWATRGVLLDLTEDVRAITQADGGATFMPIPLRAFEREGRFFAVPTNCHGFAMYCNLEALEKAGIPFPSGGITWAEIERLAPKLARRRGDPNAPTDYALLMPSAAIVLWANGGNLFDDPFHPTRVTANSPAAHETLAFFRRMHENGLAVPPDVATDQGSYQLFRDGKVAFYFSGRWDTPNLEKAVMRWDVAPVPAGPVRRVTQHGGTALGVNARSRNQDAARKFVRFYASRRGSAQAMLGGRNVPVFREVAFGEAFTRLSPPASITRFSETMEAGAADYLLYAPGAVEINTIFGGRVEQALSDANLPLETVLAGLQTDLQRWLDEQRKK